MTDFCLILLQMKSYLDSLAVESVLSKHLGVIIGVSVW